MTEVSTIPVTEEEDEAMAALSKAKGTATQMPRPCGHQILIALPEVEKEHEGGIVKAAATIQQEEVASVVGFVIAMGPSCYRNYAMFPTGPWCKVGDFVLIGAFRGARFKIHGKEMRLINDDAVLAVVSDPRGYSRI